MKRFLRSSVVILAIGLNISVSHAQQSLEIEHAILKDINSFYHIDFNKYQQPLKDLPIGVFDSGTGGLTVLDALINFDGNNNLNKIKHSDGLLDFANEKFIYLADQANMPYGNYNAVDKDDLLKEHIIKDFQFLLGNKYYASSLDKQAVQDKNQVKAIVIACNTATAYGYREALSFMQKTGLDIPVIGVINAAARGTLSFFDKAENGSIGVFATVGTISSKGYENTLKELIREGNYVGDLQVFNQGGFGLAEAVDEEPDFISTNLNAPRDSYRGPSLTNSNYRIERSLLDVYNFSFDKNKMLCDNIEIDDCNLMQLNDSENYVRYHLVSLLEKMRQAKGTQPLKALILGCTHYPYLINEINQVLEELRNYQDAEGKKVYAHLISNKVNIVDPSIYVAQELYDALTQKDLFNGKSDMMAQSEFYISVPNQDNQSVQLDESGRFTYDYKYGRNANLIQEYVKVVPFDSSNISADTFERFKRLIPKTYQMIDNFYIRINYLK